ncbi:MAG: SAM hydroxide adenosyltransferase, partial [Flammeovirgaceae bacterium]
DITEAAAKAITAVAHTNDLSVAGDAPASIIEKFVLRPTIGADWIEGQVLFIDNFENVVINITREEFEEHRQGRPFKIVFTRNEVIETLSEHYAAVAENEKLAWFNSAGYLEIAVNRGNMAGLFGLQGFNEASQQLPTNQQNKWFYQTVRVYFE